MGYQFDMNSIAEARGRHRSTVKIGIVGGAGFVGAATAQQLAHSGLASEIVLIDVCQDKADGHALDMSDATVFSTGTRVVAGGYGDLHGANIVIVTAGFAQKPGETRLDLVNNNFKIFQNVIPRIAENAPDCFLLITTNPVDVLTYVALKLSKFPANRVIGSGTLLDSARLRRQLGNLFDVSPSSVQALVVGEHGDSEVAALSLATIGGIKLEDFLRGVVVASKLVKDDISNPGQYVDIQVKKCAERTKMAAYEIIKRKGATDCGIAASLTTICRALLRDEGVAMPVSRLGSYADVDDICLSVPHRVGCDGARPIGTGTLRLSTDEEEGLRSSALRIKEVIATLDFSET
jgi:L-lactate dehydrogenase